MSGSFVGTWYYGDNDDETVTGTTAGEIFYGEGGRDTLRGAGGDDVIYGGMDSDVLRGGDGDDSIEDGYGRDRLYGEAGDDDLRYVGDFYAGGPDLFDGGDGQDELSIDLDKDERFTIAVDLTSVKLNGSTLLTAKSMETLSLSVSGGAAVRATGGEYKDFVSTDYSDRSNDVIKTLGGDDFVSVGDGGDFVDAGAGNDIVLAYLGGRDTIRTGAGDDELVLAKFYNGVKADGAALYDLGAGQDTLTFDETSGSTFDGTILRLDGVFAGKVIGYEHLEYVGSSASTTFGGTSRTDEIRMGFGDDTASGAQGDDLIQGGFGDDMLDGGADRDTIDFSDKDADHGFTKPSLTITLRGGQTGTAVIRDGRSVEIDTFKNFENVVGTEGADRITGDAAANVLDGGLGTDVLRGLKGADTFVFSYAFDLFGPVSRSDIDHIVDFSSVQDSISLSQSRFEGLRGDAETGALLSYQFKDITSASAKLDANDRILYDKTTGRLSYDPDGSGSAAKVAFAILDNHAGVSANDVFVV